jgi:hypothetical protein
MITFFFLAYFPHHAGQHDLVYASQWVFMGATLCLLLLGYINQVTTSLLHQLGGHAKEAASKVRYARQSKVDF